SPGSQELIHPRRRLEERRLGGVAVRDLPGVVDERLEDERLARLGAGGDQADQDRQDDAARVGLAEGEETDRQGPDVGLLRGSVAHEGAGYTPWRGGGSNPRQARAYQALS